jgi:hypothetical protein
MAHLFVYVLFGVKFARLYEMIHSPTTACCIRQVFEVTMVPGSFGYPYVYHFSISANISGMLEDSMATSDGHARET